MIDQFGRSIAVGDQVTITGSLIDLIEDPNYINCTVQLDQQMPPSGAQVRIDLNTQQLVLKGQSQTEQQPRTPPPSRLAAQQQARQATTLQIRLKLSELKMLVQKLAQSSQQQQQDLGQS